MGSGRPPNINNNNQTPPTMTPPTPVHDFLVGVSGDPDTHHRNALNLSQGEAFDPPAAEPHGPCMHLADVVEALFTTAANAKAAKDEGDLEEAMMHLRGAKEGLNQVRYV